MPAPRIPIDDVRALRDTALTRLDARPSPDVVDAVVKLGLSFIDHDAPEEAEKLADAALAHRALLNPETGSDLCELLDSVERVEERDSVLAELSAPLQLLTRIRFVPGTLVRHLDRYCTDPPTPAERDALLDVACAPTETMTRYLASHKLPERYVGLVAMRTYSCALRHAYDARPALYGIFLTPLADELAAEPDPELTRTADMLTTQMNHERPTVPGARDPLLNRIQEIIQQSRKPAPDTTAGTAVTPEKMQGALAELVRRSDPAPPP